MNTAFTAASHHDVLVLIIQIAVLLLVARAFGEIAQRLGQPSVVGEILSGIVLGPSLLSSLVPGLGAWILPQSPTQGYLLEVISLLGVMFLLLITGLETDLALIRRKAGAAVGASVGGVVVPFATGLLLAWYLPGTLLAAPDQRLVFALFVATAMSISAIPVIAKVLMDMKLMRRDIGQTIIAAGMTDDAIGWIMLSIVAGLAAGESVTAGSVARAVGSVAAFMLLSFTAGRWLVRRALDFVQDEVTSRDRLLTLVVVLTFAWGAITQALNLEAVLGAFFMGILFGQTPRLPGVVVQKLESVALGIFAPIFFGVAGLKVDLRGLLTPELMAVAIVVILVACFGKVAGTYAGARLIGRTDHWTALSLGAGLNARGAMEIIVATIGLTLGILTQEMYSIIVLMAVATSLMAPPSLRWTLRHVVPEQQELERLERERLREHSRIAGMRRVLLPVRQRPGVDAIGQLRRLAVTRLGEGQAMSITILTVAEPGERSAGLAFIEGLDADLAGTEVIRKVVESDDAASAILEEAGKDYDLVVVGATERPGDSAVFHPMVDELVRLSPCPTMIVRGVHEEEDWQPRRILVPTNGSVASRGAAEVAFAIAAGSPDTEVMILNVPMEPESALQAGAASPFDERLVLAGWQMVEELADLGRSGGVRTMPEVRADARVEEVMLRAATSEGVDLIVLGTDVRAGSGRLFLGPRVERILATAPCPVMVINGV